MTKNGLWLKPTDSFLLYGLTGSGKTTQLAELIKATEKPGLVYVTDYGGIAPLEGVADLEVFRYGMDPFVWLDAAVQGKRFVNGKWIASDLSTYGLIGMDSLSGMGDLIMNGLGKQAADGKAIGGEPAPALTITAEGQTIKVPSSSRTHYLVAQKYLLEKVWQSQALPCPVLWTAHEDIGDAGDLASSPGVKGIIGPMVAGHALTTGLPKYFVYTFRLKIELLPPVGSVQHVLYSTRRKDGFYEALANNRAPLGSTIPSRQQPADVVQLLSLLQAARPPTVRT